MHLPISWIFIRLLPLTYTIKIVKKLIKKKIVPVLYFHSWEFYEVKNKKIPFYITKNTGLKFCKKFERFLKNFKDEKFVTLNEMPT